MILETAWSLLPHACRMQIKSLEANQQSDAKEEKARSKGKGKKAA